MIIVRIITNISLIDIYFSILVICLLDLILILKGEILSWSFMGVQLMGLFKGRQTFTGFSKQLSANKLSAINLKL